jgi:predicted DNA binding CopG/RHH family protein
MKKSVKKSISPEEAIQYIEDMQVMQSEIDDKTVAISLRIPQNLLRALKTKAKIDGKKYQSLLVDYIRIGIKSK